MSCELKIYEDRPSEFWLQMGPFFAARKVRREMPYLVDDDGYVWFVLLDQGRVLGFASCHVDKHQVGHLHGLYVDPAYRTNGMAQRLVDARVKWLREHGAKGARATVNAQSLPVLQRCGFEPVKARGSYTVVEVCFE